MYSDEVMKLFRKPRNMGEIKDADGYGKVGNPVCVTKDVEVVGNPDIHKIAEVKSGTRVLGHDGYFHNVDKSFSRDYFGEIIAVKNKLGTTKVTPEHLVYAIKVPKKHAFYYARNKKTLTNVTGWYEAQELEKRDIIAYPLLKETKNMNYLETKVEKSKYDHKSKTIPKKIKVDKKFLRLAGYYISEGSFRDEPSKSYLQFTFNSTERHYVADVRAIIKTIFHLDAKIVDKSDKNVLEVVVYNAHLARLFGKLFGKGAKMKQVPAEFMLLPPNKQRGLIEGLWKGDGYFNSKKPRAEYTTISRKLAEQVKTLLLRQEIVPSLYREEEATKKGVKRQKAYRTHVGGRKSLERLSKIIGSKIETKKEIKEDSWFDNNYLYIPLTSVKTEDYHGKVYDLAIPSTHSFVTDSLTVHNCGDLMEVFIKVKDNRIVNIKAKTFGCVAAIATSSMITDLARGKTLEEAEKLTNRDIADSLKGLPPAKLHCSVLAADALKNAIKDYRERHGVKG